MRIPVVKGVIDRRILANYRIDPQVLAQALPDPFRPHVYKGFAIGGICLIRLKKIRPKFMPIPMGISSENAAHRISVEWEEDGQTKYGVYIPRRDTNSRLNAIAGGTVFPGEHHMARFEIDEMDDHYSVKMTSNDGLANVSVSGMVANALPVASVFGSIQDASDFFEQGALGYSSTKTEGKFEGLECRCNNWSVKALDVDSVQSSYFDDRSMFPEGSVQFDCALLMTNIDHQWHGKADLCCNVAISEK